MTRRFVGAAAGAATLALLVSLDAAAQSAPSPTPAVSMWGPNAAGPMARVGTTLYVGGDFDYVGPPTGSFGIVDAADATQWNTAARLLQSTPIVRPDGAGGWFALSGDGSPFGGAATGAVTVTHIVSAGVDPAWAAPPVSGGSIIQMAVDGPRVYIAGSFTAVGGVPRSGLAALDAATGALLPFVAPLSAPTIFPDLMADGGYVYLAGASTPTGFSVLDGVTGAAVPFATPLGGATGAIRAALGARVYAAGACRPQSSAPTVCAYDRAGVPLPSWTPPVNVQAFEIVATATTVYVRETSGAPSTLRAFDAATGAALPGWTIPTFTGGGAAVQSMAAAGTTLYVVGSFTTVNGQARGRIAALDAASGALLPWAPTVGGLPTVGVSAIAAAQGRVAIGGFFPSAGGITRRYLAALDLTTGLPVNAAPTATRPVSALTAAGDLVVVAEGGAFTGAPGELYAFSAASGTRYPVALPFTGFIRALEVSGGTLFIGGQFAFGSEPLRAVAAYDLVNGRLLPWNPAFSPYIGGDAGTLQPADVRVLLARGGRLYAGGSFPAVDGSPRGYGAAFDLATLSLTSWDPGLENPGMLGLEQWQDRLLVSAYDRTRGTVLTGLRWVDPASGDRRNFPLQQSPSSTGRIGRAGDTLIIGGAALVALDARTGQQQAWPTGITRADYVLAFDDLVIVAGAFNAVNGQPAANLAVFRTAAPAPPRSLTLAVNQSTVSFGWTSGGGNTTTGYVIEAGTGPGLAEFGRIPVGAATNVAANVGPGSYALRVLAVGPTGISAASSDVLFTIPMPATAPTAPANLTITVLPGNLLSLSWTPSVNATTYLVEGGTASGLTNLGVLPTGVLDTNIAGTVPAGTYYLRLRAANQYGVSGASNEVRVVVP